MSRSITRVVQTDSVEDTRAAGAEAARSAAPGDVFALTGDLGAGKTEFVRGFVAELTPNARVQSPSFAILNIYPTPACPVYHFDFYRLTDPDELIEIGLDEYFRGEGVCLIEWAEQFREILPEDTKTIRFTDEGPGKRRIEFIE